MTRENARKYVFGAVAMYTLAGCAADEGSTDSASILRSLMSLLTSDGKTVCLDRTTSGEPLTIFRNMMEAPFAEQRRLLWYHPAPFRPINRVTAYEIFKDQMAADRVVLREPAKDSGVLAMQLQSQINFAARRLSLVQDSRRSWLPRSPKLPLARPQWWIFNQLDTRCGSVYSVTNPIIAKNVAFLSVTADHWGTTYAFQKKGQSWAPLAQWANWLY